MHRLKVAAALTVAGLFVGFAASPATADHTLRHTHSQATSAAAGAKAGLSESTRALAGATAALLEVERALPSTRLAAAQARTALIVSQARNQAITVQIDDAQSEVARNQAAVDGAGVQLASGRRTLGQIARAMYMSGPMADVASVLNADSTSSLTERIQFTRIVAARQIASVNQVRTAQIVLLAGQQRLQQTVELLAVRQAQAARELQRSRQLSATRMEAEAGLNQLLQARRQAMDAARAAQAEDLRQYRALIGEADRLRRILRAQAAPGGGGPAGNPTGLLTWPVRGPITSPFGMRRHPITGVYKLHTGIDIGASCGTPIRAAATGTVLEAGYNSAYGWRTVMTNGVVSGRNLATTYNHQSRLGVAAGQRVSLGQIIGWVGSTGYSTGCHLHFEVLVNGEFVDPLGWL